MPTTFGVVASLGDVLTATKRVMVTANLGSTDIIKLSSQLRTDPPIAPQSNEMWIISPGENWVWQDGREFAGNGVLFITGDLNISYWKRIDIDQPDLADSMLTDTTLGTDGKLTTLLDLFVDETGTATLQDGSSNSFLTKPLQLRGYRFHPQPIGTQWRGFTAVYECEYVQK